MGFFFGSFAYAVGSGLKIFAGLDWSFFDISIFGVYFLLLINIEIVWVRFVVLVH